MELSRIKNLVKQNGDRFIIVENGEPEVVVMSFEEYSRMANPALSEKGGVNGGGLGHKQAVSPARAKILAEKETEAETEIEIPSPEVRLEDLPL